MRVPSEQSPCLIVLRMLEVTDPMVIFPTSLNRRQDGVEGKLHVAETDLAQLPYSGEVHG